jgi:hypothetical protein
MSYSYESGDEEPEEELANAGGSAFDSYVGQGLGCLLVCVGIAIVIWALNGFPGLPR